jgi:hypothetical protein
MFLNLNSTLNGLIYVISLFLSILIPLLHLSFIKKYSRRISAKKNNVPDKQQNIVLPWQEFFVKGLATSLMFICILLISTFVVKLS